MELATECLRCGIIFAKYRPRAVHPPSVSTIHRWQDSPWVVTARLWLIESDSRSDLAALAGRGLLYGLLIWWGLAFSTASVDANYVGQSFLHLINLPFHEAGHVLFSPFGRFFMILGGILGQVLMPLVCLGTFLVKTRDPFGAAVALWWMAESLMDLAPYINDARAMDLILLGGVTGRESGGHDWNNLLTMLNLLEWDHRLAYLTHGLGVLLMFTSLAWGGWLLVRHYARWRNRL